MSIDLEILRKIKLGEKYQGPIFEKISGDPKPQGDPEVAKVQGESLEGVVI